MNKLIKIVLGLVALSGCVLFYQALRLDPDVEIGATAPEVTFTALDDSPLPLADLRGSFVLLDFWGST